MTEDLENREPPRRHRLRAFLIFLLVLLAVLAAVVFAAYRDGTGLDVLRRYFSYGSADSQGEETDFRYDASSDNRFAVLGDDLAVLSGTELQVLDGSGKQIYSTPVKMAQPALASGGGCAVAYDVGGTQLIVVDGTGERLTLTADASEPWIAATLNSQGWLAATSEKKSYKASVSVYNDQMELVFTFNSSERFVSDAYVTDDGKTLAAVTMGQENSVFVSNLVFYDLTETEPFADYDVTDGLAYSIGQTGNSLVTVADTCLSFSGTDGKAGAVYDYGGAYLRGYALGDGAEALLLNRYRSGSVGRLVCVGTDGKELASLDVSEEVLDISAAGRYLAVLYADRMVVYTQDLQEYASLNGTDFARGVLMRPDGSALLVSSDRATLFLP